VQQIKRDSADALRLSIAAAGAKSVTKTKHTQEHAEVSTQKAKKISPKKRASSVTEEAKTDSPAPKRAKVPAIEKPKKRGRPRMNAPALT
jgi:hypothetical protein